MRSFDYDPPRLPLYSKLLGNNGYHAWRVLLILRSRRGTSRGEPRQSHASHNGDVTLAEPADLRDDL